MEIEQIIVELEEKFRCKIDEIMRTQTELNDKKNMLYKEYWDIEDSILILKGKQPLNHGNEQSTKKI